ncbi:MAG: hypothetical protein ACREQ4_08310 [Candidatus Binataceae bacterium]
MASKSDKSLTINPAGVVERARAAVKTLLELARDKDGYLAERCAHIVTFAFDQLAHSIAGVETAGTLVCSCCRRRLTETVEQLYAHIDETAVRAQSVSWPREVFVRKLRKAMAPGDRIIFVAIGACTVQRPDGSAFIVREE